MRNKEKDVAQMAIKRARFLEKACELFTKKNIESVSMVEIAKASGYGTKAEGSASCEIHAGIENGGEDCFVEKDRKAGLFLLP